MANRNQKRGQGGKFVSSKAAKSSSVNSEASAKRENKGIDTPNIWRPLGSSSGTFGSYGTYDVYGSQPNPTSSDLLLAYEDIVYSCVNLIAHDVATTRIRLVATTGQGQPIPRSRTKSIAQTERKRIEAEYIKFCRKAVNVEEVTDHPLLDLIDTPNPHHSFGKLLGMTEVYLELIGSAFWFIVRNELKNPQQLWLLPSQNIQILTDDNGRVTGYRNTADGDREKVLKPEDVIHFKFFNPSDPYAGFGIPPLRAVWQRVMLLRQEMTSLQSILTNMSYPSALIHPPEGEQYTDMQAERIARQMSERFRFGNQGGVWVVQDGMEYQPVSPPPSDLSAFSMYDQIRKSVANAYSVPLPLIDMDGQNGGVVNTARRFFQMNCLKPRIINLMDTLTHRLCPDRLFFSTDDIVDPDLAFELQRTSALFQANLITVNEARATQGLDPTSDGNKFLYQIIGTGNGGGTMGTLPSFVQNNSKASIEPSKKKSVEPVGTVTRYNSTLPDAEPLAQALRTVFVKQAQSLNVAVGTETKAFLPYSDWFRELSREITPVMRAYYDDGAKSVYAALGGDTSVPLLPVQSLDRAAAKAVARLADSTLRTTELDIQAAYGATREAIEAGLSRGEADAQLVTRIQEIFTDLTERRCRLIAETESSQAKHSGELIAVKESGVEAKKEWLPDAMACPLCLSFAEKGAIPLNEPFAVIGTGAYSVVDHPPGHCSCRCNLTYRFDG